MPLTKIQSLGITDGTIVNADINASAAIASTKLSGVGDNTPAFQASKSASQSLTSGTAAKVQFNTEDLDTNSNYDNATNYRFTPTTAGKYFVYLQLQLNATATNAMQEATALIYKNGSAVSVNTIGNYANNTFNAIGVHAYAIVTLNGSTDYVEAYARIYGSGTLSVYASGLENVFGAYKLIGV